MGARQIVRITVDLVRTSCGHGVPLLEFLGERDTLRDRAARKDEDGLAAYRAERNAASIDGLPTGWA